MSERRARGNGLWAVGQQVANIAFNGVFGVVLARFVSVSEFGVFSYAMALASLGVAIMGAGLYSLAIREYVARPQRARAITAAIILIREVMALIAYGVLVAVSTTAGSSQIVVASAIACLAIVARVFDAPELWYQALLKGRISALVRICVSLVFFALRIIVLWWTGDILLLLSIFAVEQLVAGAIILGLHLRNTRGMETRAHLLVEIRTLARGSYPLLLSTLANQVNLKVDALILQAVRGSFAVGIYSAAVRLSELLYALPVAYMSATFPRLLQIRDSEGAGGERYAAQLQRAYNGAFWLGIGVVVATFLAGDWVVVFIFGADYADAGAILRIHVLACPFVFMAAVFSKWIVAENLLWVSVGRHVAGAVVAVVLNFWLAADMGATGAAIATVVSYAVASYGFCFLTRSTRPVAIQMSLAVVAPVRYALRRWNKR